MTDTLPRPIVVVLELVEDAAVGRPELLLTPDTMLCSNCGRPCRIHTWISERFDLAGFSAAICTRCIVHTYDGVAEPMPSSAAQAELKAWRAAYDHEHQPGRIEPRRPTEP